MKQFFILLVIVANVLGAFYWGFFYPLRSIFRSITPDYQLKTTASVNDQTVREMAKYLETASPQQIPSPSPLPVVAPRTVPSPSPTGKDLRDAIQYFGPDFIDSIETPEIKQALKTQLNAESAPTFAKTIDEKLTASTDQDQQIEEKFKLLEVRKWLTEQHSLEGATDVFYGLAQKYYGSQSTREGDLGRLSFQYYLDQEKDSTMKEQKYKEFLKSRGIFFEETTPPQEVQQ